MQLRHTLAVACIATFVLSMFALAHWYGVPLPMRPKIVSSCKQPASARQVAQRDVAVNIFAPADYGTEEDARHFVDAQLRTEANGIAAQYRATCAEDTCAAQKTGSFDTRPAPYVLEPLAEGGYRTAPGTLVDFVVEVECVRRVRHSG